MFFHPLQNIQARKEHYGRFQGTPLSETEQRAPCAPNPRNLHALVPRVFHESVALRESASGLRSFPFPITPGQCAAEFLLAAAGSSRRPSTSFEDPKTQHNEAFPAKQPRAAWCAENSAPSTPHLAHPTSPTPCRPRRTACAVPARPALGTLPRPAQRREPTPHRNRSLKNAARGSRTRVPFDRRRRAEPEPCERIQQPDPNSVYTSNYPENR